MPQDAISGGSDLLWNSKDAALRLEGLLAGYSTRRSAVQQRLETLDGIHPPVFLGMAYRYLAFRKPVSPGAQYLAELLVKHRGLVEILIDPKLLAHDEALLTLRTATQVSPGLGAALLEHVLNGQADQNGLPRVFRALELTTGVDSVGRSNMQLTRLLSSNNPRIRAKTVQLLLGSTNGFATAVPLLEDPDPRVRATVVESLWPHAASSQVQRIFRTQLDSPVVRVSTNALVGLAKAGDPEAPRLLRERLRGEDHDLARAAAWAMGYLRDPRFREPLDACLRTGRAEIRGAVLRALVRMNQKDTTEELAREHPQTSDNATLAVLQQGVAAWNTWRATPSAARPVLDAVDLRGAVLLGFDLSFCSLRDADLREARLSLSSLFGADLSGTILAGAQLDRADLRACETDGFTDLSDTSLRGADLFGLDLRGVVLHNARMEGAHLAGTLLAAAEPDRGAA